MSRKMLFALAGVIVLLAGSPAWKADAAALSGVSSLPPLVHSSSPVETVRCVCGPRGCLRPCMAPWLLGVGSGLGSSSLLVARRCSRLPLVVSQAGRQLRLALFDFRL